MGKSRAEIQKAYRDRLKEKNKEEYLKHERERKRGYYVPTAQLAENDREKRRKRNLENLRRFYQKKKAERTRASNETETSGYESAEVQSNNETNRGRMPIRMNFPGRRKAALKRWKRNVSEAYSRIRVLEQERDKLVTKVKTTQRKVQRLNAKMEKSCTSIKNTQENDLTPRKETEKMMNEAGLTDTQKSKIRKHLLTGNALTKEIAEARKAAPRGKVKDLHSIVAGRILKRYRCLNSVNTRTGLCRHAMIKVGQKMNLNETKRRRSKLLAFEDKVVNFLKREDNSRTLPGKKDATRLKKGQKIQTYALTDYLKNLHLKFLAENPASDISLTTFIRCRPMYVLKASFTSRMCCLCTKHQNAAFTVKTLKSIGIDLPTNPESALKDIPPPAVLAEKMVEDTRLRQWKRVEVEERGRKKCVTRIVEENMRPEKMIEYTTKQMEEFKGHVERMVNQYKQLKHLKLNLPEHNIIVQLDFAENYFCRSVEEVQSAYFNKTSVTLHPCVLYYLSEDGELAHKSYITVSNEPSHRASTVVAFIEDLMPELKKVDTNLTCIHYWSDSPSSQYRNKLMFHFVQHHQEYFGVTAIWNYFESGHGKGPCDGLGGTCKRMADEASRCGKAIIQDARSFYEWAVKSSMSNVTFRFVSTDTCERKFHEFEKLALMPVNGTMKVHAVAGIDEGLFLNNVSCYCNDKCLTGRMCYQWTKTSTRSRQKSNKNRQDRTESGELLQVVEETADETPSNIEPANIDPLTEPTLKSGDFVVVLYEADVYIGCIIDEDEEEYEINFMEAKRDLFQWPRQKDALWIKKDQIIRKVQDPVPTGRSEKMFKVPEWESISNL